MKELLKEIYNCPNIIGCKKELGAKHPCSSIVLGQEKMGIKEYQLPEPWNGDIKSAPILFISSNPSISIEEEYPTEAWDEEDVSDFFINRFDGKRKMWVKDDKYILLKNGDYSKTYVRFWASVSCRARELLNKEEIKAGKDFAITEIVHCKSTNESGVKSAHEECVNRYLDRVLKISGAKVIVCLGNFSNIIYDKFCIPHGVKMYGTIKIGDLNRYIVFLPHPNARVKHKMFSNNLTKEQLEKLRGFLEYH